MCCVIPGGDHLLHLILGRIGGTNAVVLVSEFEVGPTVMLTIKRQTTCGDQAVECKLGDCSVVVD